MSEMTPGTAFADHLIRGVLGRGGMGIVYRATHVALERDVALKVIAPEFSRTRSSVAASGASARRRPRSGIRT